MFEDPRLKGFLREIIHSAIRGLIYRSLWGLPVGAALLLLAALIGVVIYFGLY